MNFRFVNNIAGIAREENEKFKELVDPFDKTSNAHKTKVRPDKQT